MKGSSNLGQKSANNLFKWELYLDVACEWVEKIVCFSVNWTNERAVRIRVGND